LISYGNVKEFYYKTYQASEDEVTKSYSNQIMSSMKFDGHTTKLVLDEADGGNGFKSELGKKIFGSTNEFSGT